MSPRRLDATALRHWAHTAVDDLIAHTDEINRLNVFPVADADTGTNMLFTMRAACALRGLGGRPGPSDVAAVTAALAEGALRGARGNSGRDPVPDPAWARRRRRPGGGRTRRRTRRRRRPGARRRAAARGRAGGRIGQRHRPRHHRLGAAGRGRRGRGRVGRRHRPRRRSCSRPPRRPSSPWTKTPHQLDVLAKAGVVDAGGRGLLVLLDAMTTDLDRAVAAPARLSAARARPPRSASPPRRHRRSSR